MIFSVNHFLLENAYGAIIIILLSLPVVLALQWSRQNGRIMALEKEKAETGAGPAQAAIESSFLLQYTKQPVCIEPGAVKANAGKHSAVVRVDALYDL